MSARLWQNDPSWNTTRRKARSRKWLKQQLARAERRARKDAERSTDRRFKGYQS